MSEASILVVDDEESVASTIRAILQLDGHDVIAVTSGTEAIALLEQREFDVVLTDLRLGDIDGIEVLRTVRRVAPETAAIMLTGYASLESAVSAIRAGAYDYLMKPSDVEELRATVGRAIERRALRKRLVQLEEVDRLKNQFLSIASHELRTPLTAVSGYVQIARRRVLRAFGGDDLPQPVREEAGRVAAALAQAQRQTQRLGRLVDELLDVARLQGGPIALRRTELDIVGLVREVVERVRLADAQATIELEPAAGTAPIVGDQDRLEQVMENLIGNALKYSARGSRVRVGVRVESDQVLISIADEGIGIPQDELTRVFDLFYRSPRADGTEGLGLGLYISHEIVTRLGGRIWAESAVGKGSTFHVRLPLATAASPAAPAATS